MKAFAMQLGFIIVMILGAVVYATILLNRPELLSPQRDTYNDMVYKSGTGWWHGFNVPSSIITSYIQQDPYTIVHPGNASMAYDFMFVLGVVCLFGAVVVVCVLYQLLDINRVQARDASGLAETDSSSSSDCQPKLSPPPPCRAPSTQDAADPIDVNLDQP